MARTPEDSVNVSENFRKRINELITENDCTKKEFAELVGVNKEVILRATKYAIIPSLSSLIKIANALQYPLKYVLGESDETDFVPSLRPTTFAIRIAEIIEENHSTFFKIATKFPFAPNAIHQWVHNNSTPSSEYLLLLSDYFNVSPDYLLGRTDCR